MPERERPTVVVTQQQSQTQEGCCSATGCGPFVAVVLIIGLVYGSLSGEYGKGWLVAAWIGVLLVLLGVFAFLDERFGWGLMDRLRGEPRDLQPEPPPDHVGRDVGNYGAVPRRPHADDPAPGPLAETSEEEAQVPTPPSAELQGVPRPDVYEQIRRLADLRDNGLITAEEFETKKRELLDRI